MLLTQLWLRAVYINYISGDPADCDTNPEFSTPGVFIEMVQAFKPHYSWNQRFSGLEIYRESKL